VRSSRLGQNIDTGSVLRGHANTPWIDNTNLRQSSRYAIDAANRSAHGPKVARTCHPGLVDGCEEKIMKIQRLSGSTGARSRAAILLQIHPVRVGCALAIALGLWAADARANDFRYHYVSFTDIELPPGFVVFIPTAIDDRGRVYGAAFDSFADHVALYNEGVVTVLQAGVPAVVNARGTLGGWVTNPETGKQQAALFHGTELQLIPLLPGEVQTFVVSLNDSDSALVRSEDPSGNNRTTYRIYSRGKTIFRFQLPNALDCTFCWAVNNQETVVGTISDASLNAFRAIRFRPPYSKPQVLGPVSTDNYSISYGIANSGDVLGASYGSSADPFRNHHGIWDRNAHFTTYFEGAGFSARMNDNKLIVLSGNDTDFNSYLVPRPGVRLNVEDLLDNPGSVEAPLSLIVGINNHGDMIGYGLCNSVSCPTFLLKRISSGHDDD
jgi:hypothetical protein